MLLRPILLFASALNAAGLGEPTLVPKGAAIGATSFGLCRTTEGYIRPIPPWVTELMQE